MLEFLNKMQTISVPYDFAITKMTPAEFITKWKDNKLSERAGAQSHFLDLCELIGMDKPTDPENYCFERGAKRTGAPGDRDGWADVW